MYDIHGVPMIDRNKWISDRAYYLWEHRNRVGLPTSPIEDWLDAEWQYERLMYHVGDFHKNFDLRG